MTSVMPELLEHVVGGAPIYNLVLDGTKVGFYRDRIEAWRRGEKIAPITMDVAWTRQCQAACNFCYASLQSSEGGKITKQIALQFLDDAAEIGVKGISLISDGESSIVPWYEESIEHGAKRGIQIGVGTNGIRLKKKMLERILPHLSYLRFNFSAGEQKRYAEIMGLKSKFYDEVIQNVKDAMAIKRRDGLSVTINMQMVCAPRDGDQIVPFAKLARTIRPDYAIVKHCADSVDGGLGVDYSEYAGLHDAFREAESLGDETFRVVVKWARIENEGKREYSRCFGPPFICQLSGNGLLAPCGMLFNEKYKAFHIGSIIEERFIDLFNSDRYWDVMNYLGSDQFDPRSRCGPNCLQDRTNDFLFKYVNGNVQLPTSAPPPHMGFL